MTRARSALVSASILALATATSAARADDPVAAEALFTEGRALLEKGRFDEACDRFTRSQQLEPAVGTLINVGECFERNKLYASAWGAFREAVNLAVKRNDPRVALARSKAARVEPRVARLTVAVDSVIAGLSVVRNGATVEPAAFNTAIPVDPGPQTLVVTAPNRRPWQTKVDLREGETSTVRIPNLVLQPSVADAPPPPVAPAQPAERPSGTPAQARVAVGLEIGGGVLLAGGLVFGALAIGKWSSVTEACPNARCPTVEERDRREGDRESASTFATASTIMGIAGGAALVTGIVLHVTAPEKQVSVVPTLDRAGAGFVATLRL